MKRFIKRAIACIAAAAMVVTAVPVSTTAAPKKAVVVSSQKQLERAIKRGMTKITIKTNKAVKITIPAGADMGNVKIVVNAKNATITNKSTVKSLTIKDAAVFTEKGTNNTIKITDKNLTLKVANQAKGTDISVAKKNANIELTVSKKAEVNAIEVAAAGVALDLDAKGAVAEVKVAETAADAKLDIDAAGTISAVTVDAKADVAVKGTTEETIKVVVNAKDTVVKAETAIDTTLNADAKVNLVAGAEGSKVSTADKVVAEVSNETTEQIKVTDSKGTETAIDAGKSATTTDETKTEEKKESTTGGSGSSSGSSSGSVTVKGKTWNVTNAAGLEKAIASAAAIDTIQITGKIEDKTSTTSRGGICYRNYDIKTPVTIKGSNDAIVYGTFTIYCDGVTLEGLTIQNRGGDFGGLDGKQKNAVNVLAADFTMTNCTVKLATKENEGLYQGHVANGLCIYPTSTTTKYVITGNTFEGYNASAESGGVKWTSTAIMITEGYSLQSRFGDNGTSATNVVIAKNNDETGIAEAQTYTNVSLEYIHNDYSGGGNKYIYSYCVDGNTAASKFAGNESRENKKMVLVNTGGSAYELEDSTGQKDYTTSTAIEFKKGYFVVTGCAVTCGTLKVETGASVKVATDAVIYCTSFEGTVTGGGKVVVNGNVTYDGNAETATGEQKQEENGNTENAETKEEASGNETKTEDTKKNTTKNSTESNTNSGDQTQSGS